MSIFCSFRRRAYSRYAALGTPPPPGSSLEAHLADCDGCRAYWDEMDALTSDLGLLLCDTPRPARSAEHAPVRLETRPCRRAGWSAVSLGLAMAASAMLGWVCWPKLQSVTPNDSAVQHVKMPDEPPLEERPASASIGNPGLQALPAFQRLTPASSFRREAALVRPILSRRRCLRPEATREPLAVAPPTASAITDSDAAQQFKQCGLVFESQGDPGLANAAYQAAYAADPTPNGAFDVGRTAEETGDMEQALVIYAGLLESDDAH